MTPARLGPAWWLIALAALGALLVAWHGSGSSLRTGGYALAGVLVLAAFLRLTPSTLSDGLAVRSRPVDVATLLIAAAAVATIFAIAKLP